MLLKGLLPEEVAFWECNILTPPLPLFDIETRAIQGAVPIRQREFRVGRSCARRALSALGLPPTAIPMGANREPVWPPGYIGSISHSRNYCVAAAAKSNSDLASLAIDIEIAGIVAADLACEICLPEEKDWLDHLDEAQMQLALTVIFSAKECAYKCQYALTRRLIGFDAIAIAIDWRSGSYAAILQQPLPPFCKGDKWQGRFHVAEGHVVTTMILPGSLS